jgi:hypothetical protein
MMGTEEDRRGRGGCARPPLPKPAPSRWALARWCSTAAGPVVIRGYFGPEGGGRQSCRDRLAHLVFGMADS